jgi:prepilin-type N-terminal cleavage/methylation domain-containing protein
MNKFTNKYSDKNGFTLIEIILSIAILVIVLFGFLSLFGMGATTIFSMGHKTKALSEAQSIVDTIINAEDTSDSFIQNIDSSTTYEKITDCSAIASGTYVNRVRYCLKDETFTVNGKDYTQKILTVLVFYNNGKNYVVVNSVVP